MLASDNNSGCRKGDVFAGASVGLGAGGGAGGGTCKTSSRASGATATATVTLSPTVTDVTDSSDMVTNGFDLDPNDSVTGGAGVNVAPQVQPSLPQTNNRDHGQPSCQPSSAPTTGQPQALPTFTPASSKAFKWGAIDGPSFGDSLNAVYAEIVHWRRNVFNVPSGKAGREFCGELARLLQCYSDGTAQESIALKAAMTLPALLLQKPHHASKTKDHSACLDRRLYLWREGRLNDLVLEGRVIQSHLARNAAKFNSDERLAQSFAKLMLVGNVRAALRLISSGGSAGVLPLDKVFDEGKDKGKTVLDVLRSKHPFAASADPAALVGGGDQMAAPPFHPTLFDRLTGPAIRSAALRTRGSAGPSGIDAAGWRRLCTSFHGASKTLCDAVASVARRLSTSYVDPTPLEAYVSCRLLPLDKMPGVRPIGVCETLRRIIGKAFMVIVGPDVQSVAGSLQLCAGQDAGVEAAVHAMRKIFDDSETEAILLVDADNAFNRLNRRVTLLNILHVCPPMAPMVINTYRLEASLFVGGSSILSSEGTTQGDPLSMAIYAIGTLPLAGKMTFVSTSSQIWFADDAAAGGNLSSLLHFWRGLLDEGPKYGYYPNATKTWLVTKDDHLMAANDIFGATGVCITSAGHPYLGTPLGSAAYSSAFLSTKVIEWVAELNCLSDIATTQPQAAYAAFIHGLRGRWTFLCRTVGDNSSFLQPLEEVIRLRFLPCLLGRDSPSDVERELLALPTRFGGLGLLNPIECCSTEYEGSLHLSDALTSAIIQQSLPPSNLSQLTRGIRNTNLAKKRHHYQVAANAVRSRLPPERQLAIDLAQEKGASSWLSVLPLEEHGFHLHKTSFRDAICLRYGWPLPRLPGHCACGSEFTVTHALSCPTGGFPTIRHNEVRNDLGELMAEVCPNVALEPVLSPVDGEQFRLRSTSLDNAARLDIKAGDFWGVVHLPLHSLMCGCSTPTWCQVEPPQLWLPAIAATSAPRSVSTSSAFGKLMEAHSPPWCSVALGAQAHLQPAT